MTTPAFQVHHAGDTAIVVEFGDRITAQINGLVLDYSEQIDALGLPGVIETVPTFRSLMIEFDPDVVTARDLIAKLPNFASASNASQGARRKWRLPVCYEGDCALDLADVAERVGLTQQEVIAHHVASSYDVFMLGFLPGQPYLGELPAGLRLPRRTSPRLRIPGGSIGIATSLTCVFPSETPCGWHIIGRTPIPMWNLQADARPLFAPGDRIEIEAIDRATYDDYQRRIACDGFRLLPIEGELACLAH